MLKPLPKVPDNTDELDSFYLLDSTDDAEYDVINEVVPSEYLKGWSEYGD